MQNSLFGRLVVLLDQLTPPRGAFRYALEWASRFHLPVRGVWAPGWYPGLSAAGDQSSNPPSPGKPPGPVQGGRLECGLEDACARACARHELGWQLTHWQRPLAAGLLPGLEAHDLLVLGQALPPAQKTVLLRQALRDDAPPVLLCPDDWSPPARILVLDEGHWTSDYFLGAAAALVQAFDARLVVLTVARSERVARLSQRRAEDALAGRGLDAIFDYLVGSDVRLSVANVARWRRCRLVLMERQASPPWWRWLRGEPVEQWADLAASLAFLALPARIPEGASANPDVSQAELGSKAQNTAAREAAQPAGP